MSEISLVIKVPKATGTHADVLAAVGLADVLTDPTQESARLIEKSDSFVVEPPTSLSDRFFARLPVGPGYPFLKTSDRVQVPPGANEPVDYRKEWDKFKEYRELRRLMRADPKLQQGQETGQQLQQLEPRSDWWLLRVLNDLQGDESANQVHAAIAALTMPERRACVQAGVAALARGEDFAPPWKAKQVQIFTPNAAKGYARLKPDSTGRGDGTKEQWARPFLEWLKYRGYFRVACPYYMGSKNEHIRILCPIPADISVVTLAGVAERLRASALYGSPAKLDSLAVLTLAELLIRHSADYHPPDVEQYDDLLLTGLTPAKVVAGITVTHYQSLGSARAVSSLETLALPDWFKITGPAAAALWLRALDDHRRVVRALDDSHSDEIGLLIQYRRFLERRGDMALHALLDFMGAYGQFLIRAREQRRRVPAFRSDCFKEVVKGLKVEYTKILDDPGFKAVAAAVRLATVTAQYWKSQGQEHREIRYDLIPDLRRKRSLSQSDPFVAAVADFISAYNVENARRREMHKPAPANVTTEQFASFCRLVEQREHGVEIVGALLCAYGTCREARDLAGDGQPQEPAAEAEVDPIEVSVGQEE